MRKSIALVILLIVAALAYSCADPAADKPKATVENAAPESNSPKPAGETLVISPENSKVEFVAAKITRSHQGSFKQFSGKIELVPKFIPDSRVTIDIDAASVVADDPQLTAHLKTPDFFDVVKFPKATFVSTKIEPISAGDTKTFNITGNLELHGVKKSITFPANIQVTPESVAVDADFAINRKDFGIVYAGKADDLIRDGVAMKLALKVPRTKP
jgi:polyisoprenoid-binding protein YceI